MFNKFNTVFALAAAAAIAIGGQTVASAATVEVSSVGGTWTSLNPMPPGVNGLNTNAVNWGTVHSSSTTGRQSGYSFVGGASGPIETDVDFELGTFTHNNFVINAGTSIEDATLSVVVNLVIGGIGRALTTSFNFDHWETLNFGETNGLCANGAGIGSGVNASGCADRVTILDNTAQQESFELDGFLYILEITGFTQAGLFFSEFWTQEDAANSAILQAQFKLIGPADPGVDPGPSPVPLPAAAWMMLTGLGALVAARARRKA